MWIDVFVLVTKVKNIFDMMLFFLQLICVTKVNNTRMGFVYKSNGMHIGIA